MQTTTNKPIRALDRYPSEIYHGGKVRAVKNLGWLLRHWKDVEHFTIRTIIEGQPLDGTLLVAWCRNGVSYSTGWAGDVEHVLSWLRRPVFRGLRVAINPPPEINASQVQGEIVL